MREIIIILGVVVLVCVKEGEMGGEDEGGVRGKMKGEGGRWERDREGRGVKGE
jgi:hypothetical protein